MKIATTFSALAFVPNIFLSFGQEYELVSKTKESELFTTESITAIEAKVEELQHATETIRYEWSGLTTLVIYPKIREIKKEEE